MYTQHKCNVDSTSQGCWQC